MQLALFRYEPIACSISESYLDGVPPERIWVGNGDLKVKVWEDHIPGLAAERDALSNLHTLTHLYENAVVKQMQIVGKGAIRVVDSHEIGLIFATANLCLPVCESGAPTPNARRLGGSSGHGSE